MTTLDLGAKINQESLESLYAALACVYTPNNLLVVTRQLSRVLNYLTTVANLQKRGRIDKIVYLDDLESSLFAQAVQGASLVVVILQDSEEDLQHFDLLWKLAKHHKVDKTNLIVKDFSRSFYYRLVSRVGPTAGLFEKAALLKKQLVIRVADNLRIIPWHTYPVCIEDFVFTLDMPNGGLLLYFGNPIEQVSKLADAVVQLLCHTTTIPDIMKLKNAFAKGDHSSLLLNVILNDKIPAMLAESLSVNEQAFYNEKLRGNTDLVIVERNLDYFPLLLSQLTYLGVLDDVYGTEDEFNGVLRNKERIHDDLFRELKHLNFSFVGPKLSKLARYINDESANARALENLGSISQFVNENLHELAATKNLLSKHLKLASGIEEKAERDLDAEHQYSMRRQWYELQNELFDLDYKQQIARVQQVMSQVVPFPIAISLVGLVSLINDGISLSDWDTIERAILLNFGLGATLILRGFLDRKLIKVTQQSSYLSNLFSRSDPVAETTTITTSGGTGGNVEVELGYGDLALVGVTGGQETYKGTYNLISKFWNLHPLQEDDLPVIETFESYPLPSFTLQSDTVPLTARIVEALYLRDFLVYKPVQSVSRRPNWKNLSLDSMLKGQTIDMNLCDDLDNRKKHVASDKRDQFVIIVFVGGITRAEISVLAYLQSRIKKKILVVTSGLVNNEKLLASMAR